MDEVTQHNAALAEEINAAIEQTESQATELDRIVDIFALEEDADEIEQFSLPPAAPPAAKPAGGVRALQDKVKQAAKSYLSRGGAALKEDWSEF